VSSLTNDRGRTIVHNIVNHRSRELDAVFTALANGHRRQIVDLLALQPSSIQRLAHDVGMSLTAIHRHIRILEDAQLLRRKKSGRVNFLAINRVGLRRVQQWAERYHTHWGSDEESLENYVRAMEAADREANHPADGSAAKESQP
jgi:DNA-binding transcriptional ArsR family regulator